MTTFCCDLEHFFLKSGDTVFPEPSGVTQWCGVIPIPELIGGRCDGLETMWRQMRCSCELTVVVEEPDE